MSLISNPSNPTIKQIRALRQRKARAESGLFYIEGIRIVGEAAQLGAAVETVIVAPQLLASDFGRQTVDTLRRRGARLLEVTPEVFAALSEKDGPQGVAAVLRQRWIALEDIRSEGELCWVALRAAQDPGNIGTILRTCDAVGCGGLILLDDSADPYDPGAVRASMGALFSMRLARADFAGFVEWKRANAWTLVGTSDAAPVDYQAVRYRPPLIVLMGSEREGLSPEQQATCDQMVSLPMVGRSDSLNLAVATGVMLYEVFNQRRAAPGA